MTCLKSLRDAAMREVNPEKQRQMLLTADNLHEAINEFCRNNSTEMMIALNGAWVRAKRALELATPPTSPTGFPSTVKQAEERKAA
jgi:hypothetical protein